MEVDCFIVDLFWALQILCQASFRFSPSLCLKLRTSWSGVLTIIGGLAIETSTQKANERERRLGKRGRIKRQGWSGGEENDRQMANNVNTREMSLWWVLGMSWLERRPPWQRRQKSFLLRLELALVFLEEERVMQQSSVSISHSFWEPRYQSCRRLHASTSYLHKQIRTSQPTR